jgi:hypothetical protein
VPAYFASPPADARERAVAADSHQQSPRRCVGRLTRGHSAPPEFDVTRTTVRQREVAKIDELAQLGRPMALRVFQRSAMVWRLAEKAPKVSWQSLRSWSPPTCRARIVTPRQDSVTRSGKVPLPEVVTPLRAVTGAVRGPQHRAVVAGAGQPHPPRGESGGSWRPSSPASCMVTGTDPGSAPPVRGGPARSDGVPHQADGLNNCHGCGSLIGPISSFRTNMPARRCGPYPHPAPLPAPNGELASGQPRESKESLMKAATCS